jgi:hypothetical protein
MISNLSDSEKSWIAREHDLPAGVEIRLLKDTLVLPWNQFLYAEGGNEKIRIAFSTHDIMVTGHGLGAMLADLLAQRVSTMREPSRAERFHPAPAPCITSISIKRVE